MPKVSFLHKIFGTTPGEGLQPKEAIAYSVTGIGQNFICTIIGSYLTVFMTEALLFGSVMILKSVRSRARSPLHFCNALHAKQF